MIVINFLNTPTLSFRIAFLLNKKGARAEGKGHITVPCTMLVVKQAAVLGAIFACIS